MGNSSAKEALEKNVPSRRIISPANRERREIDSRERSHFSLRESNHSPPELPPSYETAVCLENPNPFCPSAPPQYSTSHHSDHSNTLYPGLSDLLSHHSDGSNTLYPRLSNSSESNGSGTNVWRNSDAPSSQFSFKDSKNSSNKQPQYPGQSVFASSKYVYRTSLQENSNLSNHQVKHSSLVSMSNVHGKQVESEKTKKLAQNEKPCVESSHEKVYSVNIKSKSQKPTKVVDTDYVLQLSEKDGPYILREVKQNKGLFMAIFQKPVSPALLLILMKLVKKICACSLLDSDNIKVLKIICCDEFFDSLGDYISDLPTHKQDMAQEDWLFLVDRVLPFYECALSLIPQTVCFKMRELVIKTTLSVHGMEQYHKIERNEDVKNRLMKIENIIGIHTKTVEGINIPNCESQLSASSFPPRNSAETSDSGIRNKMDVSKAFKEKIFPEETSGEGKRFVPIYGLTSKYGNPVYKQLDKPINRQRGKSVERHFGKPFEKQHGKSTDRRGPLVKIADNDSNVFEMKALITHKIRGVQKSVFFIDKDYKEQESPKNAKFLIGFVFYLTKQQYDVNDIIILTTNEIDLQNLCSERRRFKELENITIKIMNDSDNLSASILLISFSANGLQGGAQSVCNRNMLHKAFLGAREGIFMIGNMMFLEELSPFWSVLKLAFQKYEAISTNLPLCCQTHERISVIINPEGFKNFRNGGCAMRCEMTLSCGHQCVRRCHADDLVHKEYMCHKPCTRIPDKCLRSHSCPKFCCEDCGLCTVPVMAFGNSVMCHQLPPSHKNLMQNNPAQQSSNQRVMGTSGKKQNPIPRTCQLPCGHITSGGIQITKKLDQWSVECADLCRVPCSTTLECGHACSGTCGKCRQEKVHIPCKEKKKIRLACGHRVVTKCSETVSNCEQKCFYECSHIKCRERCGVVCTPCNRPCAFKCNHSKCTKKCSELCNRQPCTKPCEKDLVCGHQCIGLCGEPCPPGPENCRVCNEGKIQRWDSSGNASFVLLEDCNHVVRANNLDKFLFNKSYKLEALECPICSYTITKTGRYLNYNKELRRSLFTIRYNKSVHLNAVKNICHKILTEIKMTTLPQEIESHPYIYQIKDILLTAVTQEDIEEETVVFLQFVRNIVCSIGIAPYSPMKWMLDVLIERYKDGFSSQVLKELYKMVLVYQQWNGKNLKENMLDLHLAISYIRMLEKETWFKCHRGHVTTYKSLIISCSLCDALEDSK